MAKHSFGAHHENSGAWVRRSPVLVCHRAGSGSVIPVAACVDPARCGFSAESLLITASLPDNRCSTTIFWFDWVYGKPMYGFFTHHFACRPPRAFAISITNVLSYRLEAMSSTNIYGTCDGKPIPIWLPITLAFASVSAGPDLLARALTATNIYAQHWETVLTSTAALQFLKLRNRRQRELGSSALRSSSVKASARVKNLSGGDAVEGDLYIEDITCAIHRRRWTVCTERIAAVACANRYVRGGDELFFTSRGGSAISLLTKSLLTRPRQAYRFPRVCGVDIIRCMATLRRCRRKRNGQTTNQRQTAGRAHQSWRWRKYFRARPSSAHSPGIVFHKVMGNGES